MRFVVIFSGLVLLLSFSNILLASNFEQGSVEIEEPMTLAHGLEEELERCVVFDNTESYTSYRCSGNRRDANWLLMLLRNEGHLDLDKIEDLFELAMEQAEDFLSDIEFKHYRLKDKIKRIKVTPFSVEVEFYPIQ